MLVRFRCPMAVRWGVSSGRYVDYLYGVEKEKTRDPELDGVLAEERLGSGRMNTRREKKGS